jgi:uncharacterized protein
MRTSFPVNAPAEVWAAMADPARLADALPGCRSVTRDDLGDGDGRGDGDAGGRGDTLRVVTEVAVASVRGLWAGTVARLDADAVRVRGSGAPGTIDLVVRADVDRTTVTVEGTVEGPLAAVGSSVLAAALRRTADDLLSALAGQDAPGPATPGPSPPAGTAAARGVGRAVAAGAAVALAGAAVLGRRLARRRSQ